MNMTERPILFKAEMVRAILAGTKTQTRRMVKPQPTSEDEAIIERAYGLDYHTETRCLACLTEGDQYYEETSLISPYGYKGDRLWVRETWAPASTRNLHRVRELTPGEHIGYKATANESHYSWRPSIFMPRWASRLTLEVTAVRVERLQEISEEDAIAEGVERMSHGFRDYLKRDIQMGDARASYASLWDSINKEPGKRFADNPLVWCISFKRVAHDPTGRREP
jgi:hypothetical protein